MTVNARAPESVTICSLAFGLLVAIPIRLFTSSTTKVVPSIPISGARIPVVPV